MRRWMIGLFVSLGIILVIVVIGCEKKESVRPERPAEKPVGVEKPVVAVSILPQRYFVRRIGGDLCTTVVLVGPGQSPHSYEPTPRQMEELSRAKVWILSGTDFELSLRPKIAALYPGLKIVDGTEGVQFRKLEAHEDEEESHDSNIDRHTWLGKEPALILARHIRDTLTSILPAQRDILEKNYQSLVKDIEEEFSRLSRELAPLKGQKVYVYHPAFGYFLDTFGILQEAVETGGKEPSSRVLSELIKRAREERVRVIFVQAQFPPQAAKTVVDAVGARVVVLDPLAEDWLENIRRMGEALKQAIPE
jgi:zinc transport system substrate-binding protein